jgi:hypothetical protein
MLQQLTLARRYQSMAANRSLPLRTRLHAAARAAEHLGLALRTARP